jgi:two-component system nitrate/nitrite response regulator NarL
MGAGEIHVAVVDDHPVVREGISCGLSVEPGLQVVAKGGTADEALAIVAGYAPDIIVMDLSMPGNVFAAITHISQSSQTKVVVFTAFSSLDSALRALDAGALGFVLKGATADELIEAINYALEEKLYIAREYASKVLGALRARKGPDRAAVASLSVREQQIVNYLLQAMTNREIAVSMKLSEKTVKRYMATLMQKLHARNRVEVAINAQKSADLRPFDRGAALQ